MSFEPTHAMIFAAGFGTRMGDLTARRPKPLLDVAGKPLLEHALDYVATVPNKVVNTHYLGEQIAEYLDGREGITLSPEDAILETGGGLKQALPTLGHGPVVTLNADTIFHGTPPLSALSSGWRDQMGALLLLVPRENALMHEGAGDFFLGADGRLTRRGSAASAPYVYSGMQILDPAGLRNIEDRAFSLNLYWDKLLQEGRVFGAVYEGAWVDVGRPEGLKAAEALLNGGAHE